MHRIPLLCIFIVSVGLIFGCGERIQNPPVRPTRPETTEPVTIGANTNNTDAIQPSTPTASPSEVSATSKPIELIEANWSELQALIAEQKDKVVVVDIWSTACEPCMKEFPHLIELQKQYSNDVVAISFDIDFAGIKNKPPEYYRERVLRFLGSQAENKVLHRMCTTAADELFAEIKLNSIPAIYVYGRDGTLARRFEGSDGQGEELSYEKQVIPFVNELIK